MYCTVKVVTTVITNANQPRILIIAGNTKPIAVPTPVITRISFGGESRLRSAHTYAHQINWLR